MKKTLLIILCLASGLVYADWPQFRGAHRDGFSPETNLLKTWPEEGPELLWSNDSIGEGYSSAIVVNKMIYTLGQTDLVEVLSAIDTRGKLLWQKPIGKDTEDGNPNSFGAPTFYQSRLYVVTKQGDVACLDAITGDRVWGLNLKTEFESGSFESPLVVDGKVIVTPGGDRTTMAALSSSTGKTVWASESLKDDTQFVSPVLVQVNDIKLIITSTKNHTLAVDLESGKIVWHDQGPTNFFVPLPGGQQVHFSSWQNGSRMLDISNDGKTLGYKWRDNIGVKRSGGGVKLGNRLYGTYDRRAGIFCLDWETGEQLAFNRAIRGANLLVADGMIYCYEDKRGRVSLLKPTEDAIEIISSFEVPLGEGHHFAHMSLSDGTLFVRHGNILMAYDVKQP
ncbi:PQQ-binding-like beta-propeller repeat protein [Planctomycetota bacterium]